MAKINEIAIKRNIYQDKQEGYDGFSGLSSQDSKKQKKVIPLKYFKKQRLISKLSNPR